MALRRAQIEDSTGHRAVAEYAEAAVRGLTLVCMNLVTPACPANTTALMKFELREAESSKGLVRVLLSS